jgi:hypothetical protein
MFETGRLRKMSSTVLTLSHGDVKATVELPWDADAYSVLEAVKGLMTCVGWAEGTMDTIVRQYAEEMDLFNDAADDQEHDVE